MSGVIFLCFLQGVEEPFYVTVDKTDTIAFLKEAILFRKREIIHNVDISRLKIWKVSVPSDNIAGLKKALPEAVNPVELGGESLVSDIAGKVFRNTNIQVFMGEDVKNIPALEDEIRKILALEDEIRKIPALEDEIKELKTVISELTKQIQKITDKFESLDIKGKQASTSRTHKNLDDVIVLKREFIRLYDKFKPRIPLTFSKIAREASKGSIGEDTVGSLYNDKNKSITTDQNKKAIRSWVEKLSIMEGDEM